MGPPVVLEHRPAEGVERRDVDVVGEGAQEPVEAVEELLGGLVGEGGDQQAPGVDAVLELQPGGPPDHDGGLPRPGAGDDEQRAAGVGDGAALGVGEAVGEEVGRVGDRIGGGRVACGPSGSEAPGGERVAGMARVGLLSRGTRARGGGRGRGRLFVEPGLPGVSRVAGVDARVDRLSRQS